MAHSGLKTLDAVCEIFCTKSYFSYGLGMTIFPNYNSSVKPLLQQLHQKYSRQARYLCLSTPGGVYEMRHKLEI